MADSTTSSAPKNSGGFIALLACLLAVLGVLFHRSFRPELVLFANDGPLGAQMAQADHAWNNLLGCWQHLNWVGSRHPGGLLGTGYLLLALLGPLAYSKFSVPISLLILGSSAWLCFRNHGFKPTVCVLGGLAAALNMNAFSVGCWGLPVWTLSRASFFLALAALPAISIHRFWMRAVLAGVAIGMCVTDGFDVGAIYSLYFGLFVAFRALVGKGPVISKTGQGAAAVAVVAVCAALVAAQALSILIGTQVKGIVGMDQDEKSRQERWAAATASSLAKAEALRLVIPGLFGYRIPELYGEPPPAGQGANYWGTMGQPAGANPAVRHSGNGEYAGVVVTLVALWACVQSFRKRNNPFTEDERRAVWFWGGAAMLSLLLAFGRHAPLYRLFYALPYFSTIRNPFKFLHPLHAILPILFAYGLQGLFRLYLSKASAAGQSLRDQISGWWKTAPGWDRRWTLGCIVATGASLIGWLIYASSKSELIRHLQAVGFPEGQFPGLAAAIAGFSIAEVGTFIVFLVLSIALVTLIVSGVFSGARATWAGFATGLLLVVDLARADIPWMVYYNYKDKYATNPIIERLRESSYERRVSTELMPLSRAFLLPGNASQLYYGEWLQHHFQYYRIQALDIIQLPREPEFDKAFMVALRPSPQAIYALFKILGLIDPRMNLPTPPANDGTAFRCGRVWQLTNTRYLLGGTNLLNEMLNSLIDPGQQRFRTVARFNLAAKPGVAEATRLDQLTAVADPNGPFALFEFAAALPRASLVTRWEVSTNDQGTLQRLASAEFDPAQMVIVTGQMPNSAAATSTNQSAGTVVIDHYEPKVVRLTADAVTHSVLLLNDRHDPNWAVFIDGRPESLLRCNYLMRGVYLAPGKHVVEFRFQPPLTAFCISLASLVAGVLLCGYLVVTKKSPPPTEPPPPAANQPTATVDRKLKSAASGKSGGAK